MKATIKHPRALLAKASAASFAESSLYRVLSHTLLLAAASDAAGDTKAFEKRGFVRISGGWFSDVYSHPKAPDVVFKLGCRTVPCPTNDTNMPYAERHYDGYFLWAWLCHEYQQQEGYFSLLPQFKGMVHEAVGSVYVIERLNDVADALAKDAAASMRVVFQHQRRSSMCTPKELARAKNFMRYVKRMLHDPDAKVHPIDCWDIHNGNVMARNTPQGTEYVLTDPWGTLCGQEYA